MVHAFHGLLSIYVFSYFPFGFKGRIWDLIVSVPDHCLCFYLLWNLQDQLASLDQILYVSSVGGEWLLLGFGADFIKTVVVMATESAH